MTGFGAAPVRTPTPVTDGSCGDGWFALIEQLCADLQAAVDAGTIPQPVAVQVKEKYAELRFYLDNSSEEAERLVDEASQRSLEICETCGAPGDGWYTLIDDLCTKIETAMLAAPQTYVRVQQVKQKLGYLEFYVGLEEDTATVEYLIQESRERSATTCEKCGEPGRLRTDGWLIVLCDAHHRDRSWMEYA